MMKRLSAIALTIVMLLSVLPLTVLALPADEAYAVLDNNVLTFYYDSERDSRTGTTYDVYADSRKDGTPWSAHGTPFASVESIVIDDGFKNFDELVSTNLWFSTNEGGSQVKSITGLGNINTTNLTDVSRMFTSLKMLETIDFGDFKASGIVTAESLFSGCEKLKSIDVSGLDTSNVVSMKGMFTGCKALTDLDLSTFVTSKVTDMSSMFFNCSSLENIDLSSFDTSNVTDMTSMFSGCKALAQIDVSGFDTSKVTNMSSMFQMCTSLSKLDLSSFSTEAKPEIRWMFAGSAGLERIYAGDKWNAGECTGNLPFTSCSAKLVGGLGTVWNSGNSGAEFAKIDGGTDAPGYFSPVVTVKADDIGKACGESETLTAQQTGAYDGDKVNYTLSREPGEIPGTYVITPAGDEYQGAYKVVYKTGTLTISHKTPEEIPGKAPEVGTPGFKECFKCPGCGKFFEDEEGKIEITDYEAWKTEGGKGYIKPLEHTHNPVLVNGQAATESTAGWKDYYECKDVIDACNGYFEDAAGLVPIPDLDAWKANGGRGYIARLIHGITPVTGKDAADIEAGYKAYYECKTCGKYYEDASGLVEITDLDTWKAEGGKGYLAPRHGSDDDHDHLCDVCGRLVSEHNGVLVKGAEPTLQTAGYKDYYKCECGKYFEDTACKVEINDLERWKADGGNGYLAKLKEEPKTPETGDTSNIAFWMMMLVISFAGLCYCIVLAKKKMGEQ